MDSWEKFDLPVPLNKKHYYSEITDSNITAEDVNHGKDVCNTLKINNLGQYHDLYVQSYTILLANVFENFRDKGLDIDKLKTLHTIYRHMDYHSTPV